MNFFKLYMGDYQRDTGALSIAEHGAYFLMLQYHYATEKPLPLGKDLYRLLRCSSKIDREAVDSVAKQFWQETIGGWTNKRALDEMSKADHQRTVNREVGKLGGRPKKTEPLTESVPVRPPNDNPNQTPDTRTIKEKSQKLSSAVADLPGFIRFWSAWPRSERKQGKAKCSALWKRRRLEDKTDSIVAHVEHMAKSASWIGGFDPMPETYLNGDRWDGADLTAPASGSPDYSAVFATLEDGV